jgi:hypothetical protein
MNTLFVKISIKFRNQWEPLDTYLFGILNPSKRMINNFTCKPHQKYKNLNLLKEKRMEKLHLPRKKGRQRKRPLMFMIIFGQRLVIKRT